VRPVDQYYINDKDTNVIHAELLFTDFLIEHNIAVRFFVSDPVLRSRVSHASLGGL
jgi:hypothetical protein